MNDNCIRKSKQDFFQNWEKLREEYADVLAEPDYEGLVIPRENLEEEVCKAVL